MTKYRVNFSEVEDFEPIPSGVYKLVATDFEEREGPAAPYIAYTFEVDEGEHSGRKLWTNLSMSPKAAFKVKEFCIAMGEDPSTLTDDFEFDPEVYLGVQCRALVVQEKFEGKTNNKIDQFLTLEPTPEEQQQKTGSSSSSNSRPRRRVIR